MNDSCKQWMKISKQLTIKKQNQFFEVKGFNDTEEAAYKTIKILVVKAEYNFIGVNWFKICPLSLYKYRISEEILCNSYEKT